MDIPAIGFAIGFDRTVEAMEANGLISPQTTKTLALVAINAPEAENQALEVLSELRSNNINSEIWLDPNSKLEKQLKYADNKGIRYAVIVGLSGDSGIALKDLSNRTQETVTINELVEKIKTVIPA